MQAVYNELVAPYNNQLVAMEMLAFSLCESILFLLQKGTSVAMNKGLSSSLLIEHFALRHS